MEQEKENLLFYFVENFKKIYYSKFPYRKPLLITAENEYGVEVTCLIIT